ncbi:MAG TPA: hypothetical protein DCK76_00035 [Desulfotomaculum sp.]|nr:hypothetical protein [Desulfotomaculum sp.]HBY03933.1 hypothetical protein [Desulfotomaculum sp.]
MEYYQGKPVTRRKSRAGVGIGGSMDITGNYVESDIPLSRISTIDVCEMGIKKHNVAALIEVDVTKARRLIKDYRNKTGKRLSFTPI